MIKIHLVFQKNSTFKMKFAAVFLLAFVACAVAGPVKIADNNVGDIVTVGIKASAKLSNEVDQSIVNVIGAYLNSQKIKVGRSGGSDNSEKPGNEIPDLKITDEMLDGIEKLLKK
jgi:hypothetical protein